MMAAWLSAGRFRVSCYALSQPGRLILDYRSPIPLRKVWYRRAHSTRISVSRYVLCVRAYFLFHLHALRHFYAVVLFYDSYFPHHPLFDIIRPPVEMNAMRKIPAIYLAINKLVKVQISQKLLLTGILRIYYTYDSSQRPFIHKLLANIMPNEQCRNQIIWLATIAHVFQWRMTIYMAKFSFISEFQIIQKQ